MSPEQVAGRVVDFRSDQFSFGSIIYELATGKRAFERSTTAETLTAIIREEPDPVGQVNPKVPSPVRWLVERCLAKDPEDRFGTTKDLARDLADVRDHLSEASFSTTTDQTAAAAAAVRSGRRAWPWLLAALVFAGIVGAAAFAGGKKAGTTTPPSFRELTFQRGEIFSARFAPDGQTIIYSAAWEGRPAEIYVSRLESPEARPFGLTGADVLSISASGEMAVSLNRHFIGPFERAGTLARIGITGGGTPREIQEDVQFADWAPDGKSLAIVRMVGSKTRVEYPIGKTLYETDGWITNLRVSPGGDAVAFINHPSIGDDGGSVAVIGRDGKVTTVARDFSTAGGLAWRLGAGKFGSRRPISAGIAIPCRRRAGRNRVLARVTGNLDTPRRRAGRAGARRARDAAALQILGFSPGDKREKDLSWARLVRSAGHLGGRDVVRVRRVRRGRRRRLFGLHATHGRVAPGKVGEGSPCRFLRTAAGCSGVTSVRKSRKSRDAADRSGITAARLQPGISLHRVRNGSPTADGSSSPPAKEPGARALTRCPGSMPSRGQPACPAGYRALLRAISPDGKFASVQDPIAGAICIRWPAGSRNGSRPRPRRGSGGLDGGQSRAVSFRPGSHSGSASSGRSSTGGGASSGGNSCRSTRPGSAAVASALTPDGPDVRLLLQPRHPLRPLPRRGHS